MPKRTNMDRRFRRGLIAAVLLLLVSSQAQAVDEINTTFFGNLAIKGYDAVAYFTQQSAIPGSKEFELSWKGAKWRFVSAANRDTFREDPLRFAPQYGGYCAWAVSQNDTADIDPTQFTVHDGKLYLNYSEKISSRWLANKEAFIDEADRNWPQILSD